MAKEEYCPNFKDHGPHAWRQGLSVTFLRCPGIDNEPEPATATRLKGVDDGDGGTVYTVSETLRKLREHARTAPPSGHTEALQEALTYETHLGLARHEENTRLRRELASVRGELAVITLAAESAEAAIENAKAMLYLGRHETPQILAVLERRADERK